MRSWEKEKKSKRQTTVLLDSRKGAFQAVLLTTGQETQEQTEWKSVFQCNHTV